MQSACAIATSYLKTTDDSITASITGHSAAAFSLMKHADFPSAPRRALVSSAFGRSELPDSWKCLQLLCPLPFDEPDSRASRHSRYSLFPPQKVKQ